MIYAKTGMERMPECCRECEFEDSRGWGMNNVCYITMEVTTMFDRKTRGKQCPLTKIDETLPAQLECAELRLRKDERLGNGG